MALQHFSCHICGKPLELNTKFYMKVANGLCKNKLHFISKLEPIVLNISFQKHPVFFYLPERLYPILQSKYDTNF